MSDGQKRIRIFVIFVWLLSATSILSAEVGDQDGLSTWVAQQKAKLQASGVQNRALEARTQRTLAQSENVLRRAENQHDPQTAAVAQQALNAAKAALSKLRAVEQKDGVRLLALEKVQGWQTQVRELHPDSPTLLRQHAPSIKKGEVAVVTLQRDLYIKHGDQWVPFDASTPLGPGDQIKTGSDGHAEVMFSDHSKMDIGPNSTFIVAKIGQEESTYEFLKGTLHSIVDCLTKSDMECGRRWQVMTPNVCVCVRGTEFALDVQPDGSTLLTVLRGTVEFTDRTNQHMVMVGTGQQATMTTEGTIRGPTPVDLKSMPKWWEETK